MIRLYVVIYAAVAIAAGIGAQIGADAATDLEARGMYHPLVCHYEAKATLPTCDRKGK